MRILAVLSGSQFEPAVAGLAAIAAEHELVISCGDAGREPAGRALELALRNALPGREVTTVVTEVVISPDSTDTPELSAVPSAGVEPHAIAELRSLRVLVESGAVVVCVGGGVPVTVGVGGRMRAIEAVVDDRLTAALLARRLDADLLLMLADPGELETAGSAGRADIEAAGRFVAATGRRAAVGAPADAARIVRGEAGIEVGPAAVGSPSA